MIYSNKKNYKLIFLLSFYLIGSVAKPATELTLMLPTADRIKQKATFYSNKRRNKTLLKRALIATAAIGTGAAIGWHFYDKNKVKSNLQDSQNPISKTGSYPLPAPLNLDPSLEANENNSLPPYPTSESIKDLNTEYEREKIKYLLKKVQDKTIWKVAGKKLKKGVMIAVIGSLITWISEKPLAYMGNHLKLVSPFFDDLKSDYKLLLEELDSNLNLLSLCFENIKPSESNKSDQLFYINQAVGSFKPVVNCLEKLSGFMISNIGENTPFSSWVLDFENGVWANTLNMAKLLESKDMHIIYNDGKSKNILVDLKSSTLAMCRAFEENLSCKNK